MDVFAWPSTTISNNDAITSNERSHDRSRRKERKKERKKKEGRRKRFPPRSRLGFSRKRRRRTPRYSPRQKPNFSALSRSTRANNLTSKKSLLRPRVPRERERVAQCLLREARPVCPECLASPVGEGQQRGGRARSGGEREERGGGKRKKGREKNKRGGEREARDEKRDGGCVLR